MKVIDKTSKKVKDLTYLDVFIIKDYKNYGVCLYLNNNTFFSIDQGIKYCFDERFGKDLSIRLVRKVVNIEVEI